ncbi:WXG100 family type VII secretion target [Actinospica sp.]|jgi:WXG100 family type VII secretion target|uniref:WXG100 family type VII secretion target n=1 Tax=Actinospica sp. TaxID=1872142 RepID=UPI002CBAB10A|nr:WXG100 family type VII secretion target [Actinospica sp.]HWG28854.1 WXG100 family type VII secretion target [Actinospica sp.]
MDWNVNGDIMKVLDMLGMPMPGGNGGVLRQIAQDWNTMATAVEAQVTALDQAVAAVVPSQWTGAASDGFHQHWQTQSQEVSKGLANFRQVADSLDKYADTVDTINEEILSIAEQILAASVAGALLTIVTAGISDAVAAAADAAEALRITELIAKFTELAEQVGVDIERMVEVVGEVVSKIKSMLESLKTMLESVKATKVGSIALNFAGNFAADSAANAGSQYLSGQQVTPMADLENGALDAAGTVGTEGLLGKAGLGSRTVAGLANVGGGIFQSEAGGLLGVNGDSAFANPFSGTGLSTDVQNLEGAAADGLGGAHAAGGSVGANTRAFTITDTLGNLTTGTETSSTKLKQLLGSLNGPDGAMPVEGQ